jgi:molybdopterin molybdotransferase
MIPVDDAIQKWLGALSPLGTEEIGLQEALDRVAAKEIRLPEDLPPFSNSAMDGYAFRSEDLGKGTLEIVGEVAAGQVRDEPVESGQAVRIMTGSPVPPGADAVVPIEDVEESESTIRIVKPPDKLHIRSAGDDVRAGDLLISPGESVGLGHVALLASCGILQIRAHRRPRVAVLTTGDEVVPPEETPPPGKIRDCNLTLQRHLLERRGAAIHSLSHVVDDLDEMKSWLQSALDPAKGEPADLIVTTGGVSVGRYDLVRPMLEESGFQEIFWRVRMKPGKPVVTARRDGDPPVYACGLPGNPVSAFVGTLLYVIPAIDRLEGRKEPSLTWQTASLAEPVKAGPRTFFMTGRLEASGSNIVVHPIPRQGSHRTSTLLKSNALMRVEADSRLNAGEEVPVLLWGDL